MPLITVLHDPTGINQKELNPVPDGTKLRDWLIDEYGPNGFIVPTRLFRAPVCDENAIDLMENWDDPIHLMGDDHIIIVHCPTDPVHILIAVAVAVIASIALAPDPVPMPRVPEQESSIESPNNRLSGQTNIARPLQRIPDIYGKNKVWPDLIAKTYFEFVNNIKYVTEYLCIGRGDFLVENLKSGDTLISDIDGSVSTVFAAGADPSLLLDVFDSNEVNGQELGGPNDDQVLDLTDVLIDSYSGPSMLSTDANMAAFESMSSGETFTISNSTNNNGLFTFLAYIFLGPDPGLGLEATYTVSVSETFTTDTNDTIDVIGTGGLSGTIGPFTVPGFAVDTIWVDILAPNGLQIRQSNSRDSFVVDFDVDIQEIDGGGSAVGLVDTRTITIQDNTINALFYTFKFTPNALTTGVGYEVTLKRTSNTNNATTVQLYDLTKWGRLAGVIEVVDPDFGDVTTVLLTTKATEQAVSVSERKFNAIVTRKLRSYNLATSSIIATEAATTSFADAMLEHLTNQFLGNKATTEIDLDGLYTIQDALDNDPVYDEGELGLFSYSFSDQRVSVGDELLTIGNAVRCYVARQGNIVIFGRDEIKDDRTTLFNGRNKKPNSEKKSYRFSKPNDFDGVELQWVPEDDNEGLVIIFPEPPIAAPINPLKISAAGIKNFDQAWNRASLEFEKILRLRESVETIVTREGLFLLLKDRVGNVDGTNVIAQGGEIKSVAGDGVTIETYENLNFNAVFSGTIIMRSEDGDVSEEITVNQRGDGIPGFVLQSLPPFAMRVRGDLDYQVGTLFNFWQAQTTETVKDYSVEKVVPVDAGYVKVSLVRYDVAIYAGDNVKAGGCSGIPEGFTLGNDVGGTINGDPNIDQVFYPNGSTETSVADEALPGSWGLPEIQGVGACYEMSYSFTSEGTGDPGVSMSAGGWFNLGTARRFTPPDTDFTYEITYFIREADLGGPTLLTNSFSINQFF